MVPRALAAALATVASVGAAAFALEAVALPRPTSDQLLATRSMRWLTQHKALESTGVVDGRQMSTVCLNVRLAAVRRGPTLPGSLLITPRARLVETRVVAYALGRRLRAVDDAAAAIAALQGGCPRALERRIGRLLTLRGHVLRRRAIFRGVPLLLLGFGARNRALELLVLPRTLTPVAVRLGRRGRWRRLAPAEPSDLAGKRLRIPRAGRIRIEVPA